MTTFARAVEGIPVVASNTDRDSLFPAPSIDQRVQLRSSGEIQRFTASGWVTDLANQWPIVTDATARDTLFPLVSRAADQRVFNKATSNVERWSATLSAWVVDVTGSGGVVRENNVRSLGGVGNGSADDTTPWATAVAAGGVVAVPTGTFRSTAQKNAVANARVVGDGRSSILSTTTAGMHLLGVIAVAGVFVGAMKFAGVGGGTVLNNSAVVFSSATDGLVRDVEVTGNNGIALYATQSDHIAIERAYVHDQTHTTSNTNGSCIAFDTGVSYCSAVLSRLEGTTNTELGVLLQTTSTKNLVLACQIKNFGSYGVIDYDSVGSITNSIIVLNRIENTGLSAAFGTPSGVKGAGIYTAGTGGQIIALNQIANSNIATTTETLAPGAIGINSALAPVTVLGNVIWAPNWYGIIIVSTTNATVDEAHNVIFEPLFHGVNIKASSHVTDHGGSITMLTTVPLTRQAVVVNTTGGGGPYSNVSVENKHIRGSARAIEFNNTNNFAVRDCTISEVNGIAIRLTTGTNGILAGCMADSSANVSSVCLNLVDVTNLTVTGCVYRGGASTVIATSGTCTNSVFDKSNLISNGGMNNVDNAATGMVFEVYGSAAPTALTHQVGDTVVIRAPAGPTAPIAIKCVTVGVPGVWKNVFGMQSSSADNGDASVTLTTAAADATQRFDTVLTANRTVTLPSNATSFNGQRFWIVRTGLGAFTLTVQDASAATIKVIPSATAATVVAEFNGTAWKIAGYSLL